MIVNRHNIFFMVQATEQRLILWLYISRVKKEYLFSGALCDEYTTVPYCGFFQN
jgi:hypothetical protein